MKYLEGRATPEEAEQVNRWYGSFNDEVVEVPGNSLDMKDQTDTRLKLRLQELINHSYAQETKVIPLRRTWLARVAAAAAIIFIISTGIYFFLPRTTDTPVVNKSEPIQADPEQFKNKVILILEDGSKTSLTDAGIGEVIKQNGFRIIKVADDQLVYQLLNSSLQYPVGFLQNDK